MPRQPRPSARSVEAEPAPPADAEGSRTADALAYGGGALVLGVRAGDAARRSDQLVVPFASRWGLVMGVLVLSLSLTAFAPFVQRLPNHFSVRAWLRMIWFTGFCASCVFAFAPGAWPAARGQWPLYTLI
ncbi:hypothetical protein [Candidatus Poriferisodalis sp.]|uniref:hypothetical protein n=1 Tax=Candidatus Poriferisodalis sp. TaxID=3101277 RepID=UPI003C6F4975